jgi:hypothetical protein
LRFCPNCSVKKPVAFPGDPAVEWDHASFAGGVATSGSAQEAIDRTQHGFADGAGNAEHSMVFIPIGDVDAEKQCAYE